MSTLERPATGLTGSATQELPLLNHWIDGKDWTGAPARTGEVYNPGYGTLCRQVAFASQAEVDAAVAAAKAALPAWRDTSLVKRTRIMFRFRELLEQRSAELTEIVSREHGKVPSDAAGEIARGIEVIDFACGIPHLIKGEFAENVSTDIDSWSIRQPLGVVVGITPFNFPSMVPLWMIPIALACGNTFVLKPSERDPSAANFLAELLAEAGLPAGVFNVLHGDKDAVNALLVHPDVAAVSSVGSTPVAKHIYETATKHGKRVQALGGAKNHMIVLPDADMDLAADAAVGAAYGSAGQRCMAISVALVVGEAGDAFRDAVAKRIDALHVGPAADAAAEMGPITSSAHRERVLKLIDSGIAAGATLVRDGRDLRVEGADNGFFVGPTLFDDVTPGMDIYREEIFGPVLDIVRVDSYDEAVALINANDFANGTAIFTNDGGAARKFQHEVEVGMVGINVPIPVPMAFFSFGGWKTSLFGDTHMHGMEGVRFFTRQKTITGRWADPRMRGVRLGFPQNG